MASEAKCKKAGTKRKRNELYRKSGRKYANKARRIIKHLRRCPGDNVAVAALKRIEKNDGASVQTWKLAREFVAKELPKIRKASS